MATTIVFVHGFMGNKSTFNTMPEELVELLGPCFQDVNRGIKTEIFVYDSKGTENAAKLYQFIAELEGDVHIVSHSMGGILALDCARLYGMQKMAAPLSNLKGVISIDTPYWGLSEDVMDIASHSSLIPEPVRQIAQSASSSPWSFFAAATAVAAGVAMAASSESLRERIKTHAYDTMNFLGPLWQVHDMDSRFNVLQERPDLKFYGIYLQLKGSGTRFTRLPPPDLASHFQMLPMNSPTSVIDAHMHMFSSDKDADAYSDLLIMVMQRLKESISQVAYGI